MILFIGSTVRGATPTPTPPNLIFSESFSTSFVGQTELAGYWTSWATGTYNIWQVTEGGPVLLNKVFEGSGDPGWEGVWSTETIDISFCREVDISIDVFGLIVSVSPDSYVEFFYQTDGGSPLQWFYQTGSIGPTFVTESIGSVTGELLWITFKAVNQFQYDTYVFDNIEVIGVLFTPSPTPTPSPTVTSSPTPPPSPTPTSSPTPSSSPPPDSTSYPYSDSISGPNSISDSHDLSWALGYTFRDSEPH